MDFTSYANVSGSSDSDFRNSAAGIKSESAEDRKRAGKEKKGGCKEVSASSKTTPENAVKRDQIADETDPERR